MCNKLTHYMMVFLICTTSYAQVSFSNVAEDLGVNTTVSNTPLGNGISFADFNKDGWDDLSICTGPDDTPRFYLNIEGLLFSEVNLGLGLESYRNKQINWVDYDNDGDQDLFITSDTDGNRLFNNLGNLVFEDVTISAGLPIANMDSNGASWADVNNDGCLDLYISNHSGLISGTPNLFYLNNCDGSFTEATENVGLTNDLAPSFCAGFIDINNDGWLDLYVANDRFSPNFMYKNNGDGTFVDISESSGTGVVMDAMSVTVGDINSDGFMDIYVTNTPEDISTTFPGNALFLNNGDETFTNISSQAGTLFGGFAWGATYLDIENDGDLDLYVSSSYDGSVNSYPSNALYEQIAELAFTDSSNLGFTEDTNISYGNAIGDYNNDGLIDIAVLNNNTVIPSVWENKNFSPGNHLKVALEGTSSNRDGIGSTIEIQVNGQKQYRFVMCGEGYMSQNSFVEHFGIGEADHIDLVKVSWPSGIEDRFFDVEVNQTLTIQEGSTLSVKSHNFQSFQIFPTLTKGSLNINSSQPMIYLELMNYMGQIIKVYKIRSTSFQCDLSDLASGVYLINIVGSTGPSFKSRVIKI